jgi:hypothetical protein
VNLIRRGSISGTKDLKLRVTQGDSSTRQKFSAYFDEKGNYNDAFYDEAVKDLEVTRDRPFNEDLIPQSMKAPPLDPLPTKSLRVIDGDIVNPPE